MKCIVTHGLNIHSSRMNDLANLMSNQGYDVLNVKLLGHRGDFDEMRSMNLKKTIEQFQNDLDSFLKGYKGEVVTIGFSTGSVVQSIYLNNRKEYFSDIKQINIAPAFYLTPVANLTRLLNGRFYFPSFSPKEYRANDQLSFNAYRTLHDARDFYFKQIKGQDNWKKLFILNPEDKLIHFNKTKKYFKNDKVFLIDNYESTLDRKYSHLIIDQKSLGKKSWIDLANGINDFLGLR